MIIDRRVIAISGYPGGAFPALTWLCNTYIKLLSLQAGIFVPSTQITDAHPLCHQPQPIHYPMLGSVRPDVPATLTNILNNSTLQMHKSGCQALQQPLLNPKRLETQIT